HSSARVRCKACGRPARTPDPSRAAGGVPSFPRRRGFRYGGRMAAEHRIVGGGFLLVGIAIALILIFLFTQSGMSPKEASDKLVQEIWPALQKAEEASDYPAIRRAAQEALEVLDDGGAAAVRKNIRGLAVVDRKLEPLTRRLDEGALTKIAEGLYELDGRWYGDHAHRALARCKETVEKNLPGLRRIRETAAAAAKALEDARVGSSLPLEPPAARPAPDDEIPIASPNPIYEHDRELFRVLGVAGRDLSAALATKDPGGRATSARLRWNQTVVPGGLGADLLDVPRQADLLRQAADQIKICVEQVKEDAQAAEGMAAMIKRAVDGLASGLSPQHRAAFDEQRASFEKPENLIKALRGEFEMLQPYLGPAADLGRAFPQPFSR
ncbi:MAG: hypothetical protein ACREID_09110, partial [Planctomycetota bacterium]